MIYITGDCHNNFERFNTRNFPEQKEMTKDDYVIDRISWPGKKEKPFVFESWENQDYSKVVHAIKKYIENREKRDSVKILDSREYSCKLKEAICGEDGRESKYEYRIASTKFLPGNDRGFYNLFYEAFEYGQAHFLKAVF